MRKTQLSSSHWQAMPSPRLEPFRILQDSKDVSSEIGKKEGCHGFLNPLSIPGTVTGLGFNCNPDFGLGLYPDPSHDRNPNLDADPDTAPTPDPDAHPKFQSWS